MLQAQDGYVRILRMKDVGGGKFVVIADFKGDDGEMRQESWGITAYHLPLPNEVLGKMKSLTTNDWRAKDVKRHNIQSVGMIAVIQLVEEQPRGQILFDVKGGLYRSGLWEFYDWDSRPMQVVSLFAKVFSRVYSSDVDLQKKYLKDRDVKLLLSGAFGFVNVEDRDIMLKEIQGLRKEG